MKKWLPLVCMLLFAPVARAETLNLVGSSWPPFSEQSLPSNGMASELVAEAMRRAGYETKFVVGNWERIAQGAGMGLGGVIIGIWRTEERAQTLAFSKPYLQNVIRVAKLRDTDYTFQQLLGGERKDLAMGLVRDFAYGDILDQFDKHPRFMENQLQQVILKLRQGRIDFTVGSELALRYSIDTYFPIDAGKFALSPPIALRGLRIAVSLQHPEHATIISRFETAIEEMKGDGTYHRIIDPYRKPAGAAR